MFRRSLGITRHKSSKANTIITAPAQVTPEWVTRVLHRNGRAKNAQPTAVEVVLRKKLPYSTVYRLALKYEAVSNDPDLPRSLFLKLCGPGSTSEGANEGPEDIGRKEVEFYRDAAEGIGSPPLIRCCDAGYSDETGRSHILLDDLTETHSQPEQEHAPSEEMSRLAVEALGRAHRAWWNQEISDLGSGIWDFGTRQPDNGLVQAGRLDDKGLQKLIADLNNSVERFLAVAHLTPVQEREYRRMLGAADQIWGRMTRPDHLTVTHGDTHWWNFLYPKDPTVDSVHIFDWQLWHIDLGARDLAFLLALGGFAEPRPSLEEKLLRIYHEALSVPDYSWETLIEDYRWSAIRNLNIPVIYRTQGKRESTWRTALRRAFEAYERLDCRSLIVDRGSGSYRR